MSKKVTATLCVLAVIIMVAISNIGALSAGELQPGSSGDPVVTKGYVDKLISELKVNGNTSNNINEKIKSQEEMIEILNNEINKLKSDVARLGNQEAGNNIGNSIYEVVDVNPGEKLKGKQGTEIILRAGEGSVMASSMGGLQDVTGGVDLIKGVIPKNHLLIVPRDDGRGVAVTKKATFMIRGGYTVE